MLPFTRTPTRSPIRACTNASSPSGNTPENPELPSVATVIPSKPIRVPAHVQMHIAGQQSPSAHHDSIWAGSSVDCRWETLPNCGERLDLMSKACDMDDMDNNQQRWSIAPHKSPDVAQERVARPTTQSVPRNEEPESDRSNTAPAVAAQNSTDQSPGCLLFELLLWSSVSVGGRLGLGQTTQKPTARLRPRGWSQRLVSLGMMSARRLASELS